MANKGKTLNTLLQERVHLGCKKGMIENETVTWLQYPLDDILESGYCSELFGGISSSVGKAKQVSDKGTSTAATNGGCSRTGGAFAKSGHAVQDALALGAGRASGFATLEGGEAFNKVKTKMQRVSSSSPSKDATPSNHAKCEPSTFHSQGFTNTTLVPKERPALHNYLPAAAAPMPKQGTEKTHFSQHGATGSTCCESSHAIGPNPSNVGAAAKAQVTYTRGSNYSHITEDPVRVFPLYSDCAEHRNELVHTSPCDPGTSVRLVPPFKERQIQEAGVSTPAEVHENVIPSCSGGSESSAELSVKETSSMGKQKFEDYECQSKNAEADSAEKSQPYRHPSKRSRVAESHNLSEKRRRNRINEKLKTLQELIPNSSKTDKASILDEAIEYLKALQSQLQMMSSRSGMRLPPIVPAEMQNLPHHVQMAQMTPVHPMGFGVPVMHAGMGIGMMDLGHGMVDGRPFHALPVTSPHFNLTYPSTKVFASQNCSQPFPGMEVTPSSKIWALQQASAEPYQQVYAEPQAVSSVEMDPQQEQLPTPGFSKDR